MLLNLNFIWEYAGEIFMLCSSVFLIKILIVFGTLKLMRTTTSQSWTTGLCLFQIGELSLVLAQAGSDAGILSANEMQYVLSVSITSMILTPFVFKYAIHNESRLDSLSFKKLISRKKGATAPQVNEAEAITAGELVIPSAETEYEEASAWKRGNHAIIIGFGVAGKNVAETLKSLEIPYAIIEANYENYKKLRKENRPVTFGDATKAHILESTGIEEAKLIVLTVSSAVATKNILMAVRKSRPDVQIIVRIQYVKELENLKAVENTDLVIAELETSYELVARTLKTYGAPLEQISQFINQSKRDWQSLYADYSVSHRKSIELPAWEAMAHMRPFHMKVEDFAHGKSLSELNLRNELQVSVVTVFRRDLGTTIPSPTLELQGGDILQLIGGDEQLEKAYYFLRHGPLSTATPAS